MSVPGPESLWSLFPLLAPDSELFDSFTGFVTLQGMDFACRLAVGTDQRVVVDGSAELRATCGEAWTRIEQRAKQHNKVITFLPEFYDQLQLVAKTLPRLRGLPAAYCDRLQADLTELGWENVVSVDDSLTQIHVQFHDVAGRRHVLQLRLGPDFPAVMPDVRVDLPSAPPLRWPAAGGRLSDLVAQVRAAADAQQAVLAVLDDWDQHTWVLEPEPRTYTVLLRRVALGGHASLQMEVDPRAPRAVPECRLLGPDAVTRPLKDRFAQGLASWDERRLPRANMEALLGLTFPSPSTGSKADYADDCAICYAARLDGALPDRVCDNPHCSKPFHRACLYEWLRALPRAQQTFDTVFGVCPYCSSEISCKAPGR